MADTTPDPEVQYRPVIYQLLHISSLMLKTREHYAAAIGVTAPQFSVLMVVRESPGISVSEVANRLHVSGPFVTTETGKLIKAGLVRKRASDRDRRIAELFVTGEGAARLDEVAPVREAANAMIFSGMSQAELERFSSELNGLKQGLNKALHMMETPGDLAPDG